MKKLVLLLIAGVFFTGCATSSLQTGPTYKDLKTGKNKFDAKIVLSDDTIMLECFPPVTVVLTDAVTGERRVAHNNLKNEELLAESRCQVKAESEVEN